MNYKCKKGTNVVPFFINFCYNLNNRSQVYEKEIIIVFINVYVYDKC